MGRKMKVLQYFWGKLDAGGAESLIINLFEKMDKNRFDVDFLVYENKTYFYNDKVKKLGGNVIALSKKESRFLPIRLFKRWMNLYILLKDGQYNVFHCNCDFSLKFVELFIAKKAGIKKRVCHSHNSALDTTTLKGKISYVVHMVCRPLLVYFATDLIACSEEAADWLFGQNSKKRHGAIVINNGIDAAYYEFDKGTRDTYRFKMGVKNEILLGNIGRFTPIKNQRYLIDIIKSAKKRDLTVKAVLIGDGELLDEVKAYARESDVEDRVIFTGATKNVRDYLMAMDCFVMPSLYEGLPVSGIEAQAAGLPCVMSDTITNKLDVTGNIKFLPLTDSANKWLEAIIVFLASFSRKSEKKAIRTAGYDIDAIARIIEELYSR